MTLRPLPELSLAEAPGAMESGVSADALNRWSPDVSAAATEDNTISILEPIGEDFFGEGVTVKRISAALRRIGDGPVVVNINSPGGDVFEGVAIYNALRMHQGRVSVRVLGLAASAASIIAMAGDSVAIPASGFLMIHNTWTFAAGNRHDMREVADYLEPFDDALAGIYAERSGAKRSDIVDWMDAETWLNGSDAVEKGLADAILDPANITEIEARASATAIRKVEAAMAEKGMSRAQRRSLLSEITGGKPGAAPKPPGDDIVAKLNDLARQIGRHV